MILLVSTQRSKGYPFTAQKKAAHFLPLNTFIMLQQ